uniref:Uncharacterized protein n=1 Tax=Arundo donax TaxID=35708 RepID=A0A0A8Y4B3_ARUDO
MVGQHLGAAYCWDNLRQTVIDQEDQTGQRLYMF